MARIDRPHIPPRSALGVRGLDPVRPRDRHVPQPQGVREGELPGVEALAGTGPGEPAPSITAPSADYLRPLAGMSRDRVVASLTRIEHALARLQEHEGTADATDETTLARVMISEHLRRLRIVSAGENALTLPPRE